MGLIPWDQWFTSDHADTVDGKGVGDSELRFDTEHRGSFSICLMRRFFALWQRIRKELRDTLRPWFHAILMACFTFFARALNPLFRFLTSWTFLSSRYSWAIREWRESGSLRRHTMTEFCREA